jgi:putative GTP pyrophosphokinase
VAEPSKSQVKKAGSTMRKFFRGELPGHDAVDRAMAAVETIEAFRAAHATPLVSANNGLRSMLRTERCPVEVSQRLKRMTTILDKLRREPTLALASMQDIGGVRAILDDVAQIRRVEARLMRNRPVVGYSDYITSPRASGYRGVHVVVTYGEADRPIEVQLRTKVMHEWAITVERLGGNLGQNFKQDGDTPVQRFMAVVSEAMAIEEQGGEPPLDLVRRISRARAEMLPYLEGNR